MSAWRVEQQDDGAWRLLPPELPIYDMLSFVALVPGHENFGWAWCTAKVLPHVVEQMMCAEGWGSTAGFEQQMDLDYHYTRSRARALLALHTMAAKLNEMEGLT